MGTTTEDLRLEEILLSRELRERGLAEPRPSRGGAGAEWVRIAPDCWVRGARWRELDRRQHCLASHLAWMRRSRVPFVFSHDSAALLHGLSLLSPPDRVHISADRRLCVRDPLIAAHHRPGVGEHRTWLGAEVPVTDLPRTLIDAAALLPFEDGVVLADQVLRREDVGAAAMLRREDAGAAAMLRQVEAMPRFKGSARVRRVLGFADARADSVLESLARVALHELGIPVPQPQMPVRTRYGRKFVDLGWPRLRMGLELDGKIKYFQFGDIREVLYQERQRELAVQEAGVVLLRAGWADVRHRRSELKARLLDLASRQAAKLGVPGW